MMQNVTSTSLLQSFTLSFMLGINDVSRSTMNILASTRPNGELFTAQSTSKRNLLLI